LLGLAGTAVHVSDRGFIDVDGYCQTGEPGVYAVGDIINTPQLAHVAYSEAIVAVKHMLGEVVYPVMYDRVPWAIYCHPEVAWAGPSEEAAVAAGHDVVVAKHAFRSNSRAMILGETDGLVKIIAKKNADGTAGQVLGVHMVGPWVTEQLSGGYLAVMKLLSSFSRTHRYLKHLEKQCCRLRAAASTVNRSNTGASWLRSHFHNLEKRSPKERLRAGLKKLATRLLPTSHCSKFLQTKLILKCLHQLQER
jgi:hypothetical protein